MHRDNIQRLNIGEVHFGFGLDPAVDDQLQRAAAQVGKAEQSLLALDEARQLAPNRLEVLQAQYKFHFYRGDLHKAEDFVFQTLIKAAIQGGFNHDWSTLNAGSADWRQAHGPARFFLYALKALAFIRLRQNMPKQAREILDAMTRIDPEDRVGASVIRDLLAGLENSDD